MVREKVNITKSGIFYPPNDSIAMRNQIQIYMHISGAFGDVKYLGHNLFMHMGKTREFKKIIVNLTFKTKS